MLRNIERRLDEERLQIEAKKREREEQHLYLTAKVITDETFAQHEGFDLASFDEKNWPPSDLPTFRVLKTETYSTFKSRVAQHFNYPENQIRLWVLVNRQNKTVRPDTHIPENEATLSEYLRAYILAELMVHFSCRGNQEQHGYSAAARSPAVPRCHTRS